MAFVGFESVSFTRSRMWKNYRQYGGDRGKKKEEEDVA